MPVPNMKAKPPRPNEEPYAGKLLVRFREGLGRRLPSLLDKEAKILAKNEMIKRGVKALYKELGPVDARRFITLANEIPRENSVARHRKWQQNLDE